MLPSGKPRPRYDQDALLAVAAEVFAERGYDGTSMEHLSRASGLSKSSIYHHVEGKERDFVFAGPTAKRHGHPQAPSRLLERAITCHRARVRLNSAHPRIVPHVLVAQKM